MLFTATHTSAILQKSKKTFKGKNFSKGVIMLPEAALATSFMTSILKKPLENIISNCTSSLKDYFKYFQAKSNLDALATKIEQVGIITSIASRQPSTIDEIYYPAQVKQGKGSRLIRSADDLLSERSKLALILGTAGQGKSVFLRYLCLQELRLEKHIPLFIELRKVDGKNNLLSLIKQHLLSLGFPDGLLESAIDVMLHSGTIRLFLDGFDEINREYALGIKEQIQMLMNRNPNLQIVLSSRPGALSQYLFDINNLQHFDVAQLGEKDYRGFFEKIGVLSDTKERLIAAIDRSNAQIKQLLSTPLMLTLLVLTCGTQQDLPDTLPEFYDSLFNLLSSMHDGTKPGYVRQKATNLGNHDLETLFRAFSFATKELTDRISLNTNQFEQCISHAQKLCELKCTPEGFRTDVTETVCLMVKEGLDTTFIHKSIQEYYAASFIKNIEDDDLASQVLSSIASNHIYSWVNELRFLEDFQNLAYEKSIGIPHARIILAGICMSNRKFLTISKTKLIALIGGLKLKVARTKTSKITSNIYWLPGGANSLSNRYYPDLILVFLKELYLLNKPTPTKVGVDDSMILIPLDKLMMTDHATSERICLAAQRFCEGLNQKTTRMEERQHRKSKSLLDLMKAKRNV